MATNGNTFICLRVLVQVFKKRTLTSQKKSFHRKTITIFGGGVQLFIIIASGNIFMWIKKCTLRVFVQIAV